MLEPDVLVGTVGYGMLPVFILALCRRCGVVDQVLYSLSGVAASLYCMHVHDVLNSCHSSLLDEGPDAQ